MRRHSVLVAGLAAVLLAPQRSSAQQSPGKIQRVGLLIPGDTNSTPQVDAFREGLREPGYIEGRDVILEFRLAHGDYSQFAQLTAELVAVPVDVIVPDGGIRLVAKASGQVPVVIPNVFDPVGQGVATSLSRPGENVTGFTLMSKELDAKRLELLRTAFPYVTAVTALVNTTNSYHKLPLEVIDGAARSLGLGSVERVEAASPAALRALRPAAFSGAGAVIIVGDGMFWNFRRDVVGLVNAARLPAIYPEREYADDGGLMAYGANVADNFRRAAGYVDRVLKGAKPGDLPIQEPVKFDFVVNLKTARDLGLTIPPAILARADEVIE
jgi:putative tryptophan/tyrosine transport system substrate-binding protein